MSREELNPKEETEIGDALDDTDALELTLKEPSPDGSPQAGEHAAKRPKARRTDILDWEKKFHIIAEVESAAHKFGAKSAIARKYGIARSTLSTLLNQKQKILSLVEQGKNRGFRNKMPKFPKVDVALYEWFKEERENSNKTVSGHVLRKKAEDLAPTLGYENAQISKPWVARWKQRHGVSVRRAKKNGPVLQNLDESLAMINSIPQLQLPPCPAAPSTDTYQPSDIFSAFEFDLCWRLTPETAACMDGKSNAFKQSEEKVSVLVGANATGSEKLGLVVAGRSGNPLADKPNVIQYQCTPVGKITMDIFTKYMDDLNELMKSQGRRILLHLGSSLDEFKPCSLSNVEISRVSSESNSDVMNSILGIAKHLKLVYRERLLRSRMLSLMGSTTFTYTLVNALADLKAAWFSIAEKTIETVFTCAEQDCRQLLESEMKTFEESNIWMKACLSFGIPSSLSVANYVDSDDGMSSSNDNTVAPHVHSDDIHITDNEPLCLNKVASATETLIRYLQQQQMQGKLEDINGVLGMMDTVTDNLLATQDGLVGNGFTQRYHEG